MDTKNSNMTRNNWKGTSGKTAENCSISKGTTRGKGVRRKVAPSWLNEGEWEGGVPSAKRLKRLASHVSRFRGVFATRRSCTLPEKKASGCSREAGKVKEDNVEGSSGRLQKTGRRDVISRRLGRKKREGQGRDGEEESVTSLTGKKRRQAESYLRRPTVGWVKGKVQEIK